MNGAPSIVRCELKNNYLIEVSDNESEFSPIQYRPPR